MLIMIWAITFTATLASFHKDKKRTFESFRKSASHLKKLSPSLFGMIVIVGLILAAVPEESLSQLFSMKNVWSFIFVSLIGAVMTIPGPIAFPLAGSLLRLGVEPAILASFITTLTMVGLTSSPIEISYFGKRFTILRQGLSFISAVVIGLLMGLCL